MLVSTSARFGPADVNSSTFGSEPGPNRSIPRNNPVHSLYLLTQGSFRALFKSLLQKGAKRAKRVDRVPSGGRTHSHLTRRPRTPGGSRVGQRPLETARSAMSAGCALRYLVVAGLTATGNAARVEDEGWRGITSSTSDGLKLVVGNPSRAAVIRTILG